MIKTYTVFWSEKAKVVLKFMKYRTTSISAHAYN